jgi:hypothetical protein
MLILLVFVLDMSGGSLRQSVGASSPTSWKACSRSESWPELMMGYFGYTVFVGVELFGEYALNTSSEFLNVSYDVHVVITRKWSLGLLVLPRPPPWL